MQTIPVKKFSFGNRPAFRFPYRSAWTRSDYDAKLKAIEDGIFDENHQSVLIASADGTICAIGRSDGWVSANADKITLDPSTTYRLEQDFCCSEVYEALAATGHFTVGDYTYEVQPWK